MGERVKLTDEMVIALRAIRGVSEQSGRAWDGMADAVLAGVDLDASLRASLFSLETTRMVIDHAEKSIRQALKEPHNGN